MIRVRPTLNGDEEKLAPKLRDADLREINAVIGGDPLGVLKRSVTLSAPCYTVTDERGNPCALFGVAPDLNIEGVGQVWLLGSNDLIDHSFGVLRYSRMWVERLQQQYTILWNYVDARNEVHIRWLKWCGFQFLRLIESYGVEQRPFYEFERVRGSWIRGPTETH